MHSIQTLWAKTREVLALMQMALRDPQSIFDLVRPSRKQARELRAWLAPLEALVRKLLLIEAQAFQIAWTAGAPPAKIIRLGKAVHKETKSQRGAGGPRMPMPRFVFPIQRDRSIHASGKATAPASC